MCMSSDRIISPEEEANIRQQVRLELEHKINQTMARQEERAAREQEKLRQSEINRIRQDEEVRFYTERGYVSRGQTADSNVLWQQGEEQDRVVSRKRRKRRHHGQSFSLKHYLQEIVLAAIFFSILGMLYIYYKL